MTTFDDMVDVVESAWEARSFIVPCLVGPAGIGKTAAVRQAASNLQGRGSTGKVVTIIASQILPNEVSGITMPVPESKAMEIFDHYRLSSLKDGDILFFDELLEADQLVLSACLTLIESRELMSGNKLPDIMIVAATNPTIKPNMLKENIRQRFVWRTFNIDKEGCREYIKRLCGFDPGDVVDQLCATNGEYNILTPRSLTKMCQWICTAKDERQAYNIANQIDKIWQSRIGTRLEEFYLDRFHDPQEQMRRSIEAVLTKRNIRNEDIEAVFDEKEFRNTSISELMATLSKLPEWKEICHDLEQMEIVETKRDKVDF